MYCPNCGKQNPDEARFCGGCGFELPVNHASSAGKKREATIARSKEPQWLIDELNKLFNK